MSERISATERAAANEWVEKVEKASACVDLSQFSSPAEAVNRAFESVTDDALERISEVMLTLESQYIYSLIQAGVSVDAAERMGAVHIKTLTQRVSDRASDYMAMAVMNF